MQTLRTATKHPSQLSISGWNLAREETSLENGRMNLCRLPLALANLSHPRKNQFNIPEMRLPRAAAGSCSLGNTGRQIHGIAGPTAATAPGEVTSARWDALGREWTILGPGPESAKLRQQFTSWMKPHFYSRTRKPKALSVPISLIWINLCLPNSPHLFCFQGCCFSFNAH